MPLENRPFIGTWKLNNQQLVQHTPDALVYLNGDLSLPGCQKCSGKIDIQKFLTEVSVDAGTEAGSHSATFSLAIPLHHTESFARDAQFILRPGLEVHIYMRGYFPVRGLYSNLAESSSRNTIEGATEAPRVRTPEEAEIEAENLRRFGAAGETVKLEGFLSRKRQGSPTTIIIHESGMNHLHGTVSTLQQNGTGVHYIVNEDGTWQYAESDRVLNHTGGNNNAQSIGIEFNHAYHSRKGTTVIDAPWFDDGYYALPSQSKLELLWNTTNAVAAENNIPVQFGGLNGNTFSLGARAGTTSSGVVSHKQQAGGHADGVFPVLYMALRQRGYTPDQAYQQAVNLSTGAANNGKITLPPPVGRGTYTAPEIRQAPIPQGTYPVNKLGKIARRALEEGRLNLADSQPPVTHRGGATTPDPAPVVVDSKPEQTASGQFGPSLLQEMGLDGLGIENTLAYPYYHVFHGVVTSVSHTYTGGVSTVSVTCNSMLHFWQYHNMSTNASVFGAQPHNSKNKLSPVGNNFTGMHPYAIIYSLHYDMAGAAGGVGFALSDKTNQAAVSEGGESLFSLNVQYWERRFKRGTKLRMHAATGDLFTTMAAAWLSRNDSATLMSFLRNRYSTKKSFTRSNILAEATAVGLAGGKNKRDAITATRFAAQSQPVPRSASFEINVLEMQAFVLNYDNVGVNLFESTYESKLDVALKVCAITGFEFYQDVDGDFVFKPPMWNLDTAPSRVYRLEDIDIINISFSEKEPQVTYMTTKGGHFKGVQVSGLENEWGSRGQYIDYRLVAQFGWRPGSMETNYFADGKSMFYASVNRLDALNISVNSASVTIPVRPELRPGYPVYIPYLDCYYYCNSFAHSHSVGGQCTTTLQLVGKRAKFYAPGVVDKTGVSAIDMSNTRLPEKPLQVVGPDGRPRLAGFPNVVMALDPSEVNPLFFVVGLDIENISDTRVLSYMVQVGEKLGAIRKDEVPDVDGSVGYTINRQTGGTVTPVRFFFDPNSTPPKKSGDNGQPVNLQSAATNYMARLAAQSKADDATVLERSAAQARVNQTQTALSTLLREPNGRSPAKIGEGMAAIAAAKQRLAEIDRKLDDQKNQFEHDLRDFDRNPEYALLLEVYDLTAKAYRASAEYQADGRGNLTSTVNLLDMLSDKKAIFTDGQQPGQYRYYSASHPQPDMQGPKTIRYEGRTLKTGEPLVVENPPLIQVFNDQAPAPFPGAKPPETSLVPGRPRAGIKVLTGKPDSDGEILATSDITELMFAVQDVETVRVATSTKKKSKPSNVSPQVSQKILVQHLAPQVVPTADQNVGLAFAQGLETVFSKAKAGLVAMNTAAEAAEVVLSVPDDAFDQPVNAIGVGSGIVELNVPFGDYKWEGNITGSKTRSLGARMDRLVATEWLNRVAEALAVGITGYIQEVMLVVSRDLRGASKDVQRQVLTAWNTAFSLGEVRTAVTEQRTSGQVLKKETSYSPVFPISDAKGYRVIGSYRYGRGVDIDADGVFDQMHKYDLFSLLDRNLVDQILRVFVQGGTIKIPQYESREVNGKKVTVPVGGEVTAGGSEAAQYLNNEALRQLRAANLTDAQILDYSGAITKKEGATQLDFSLANMFAESKRDGVMKVPVVNAAFSLADLGVQQAGHICACKASEASMLIEAFGQEQFLGVSDPGDIEKDDLAPALNSWVQTQGELAASQWELQQQALRGQVLDRGGSHVVQSFQNLTGEGNPFEAAAEEREARARDLRNAARRVSTQAENVITRRNRDQ